MGGPLAILGSHVQVNPHWFLAVKELLSERTVVRVQARWR